MLASTLRSNPYCIGNLIEASAPRLESFSAVCSNPYCIGNLIEGTKLGVEYKGKKKF